MFFIQLVYLSTQVNNRCCHLAVVVDQLDQYGILEISLMAMEISQLLILYDELFLLSCMKYRIFHIFYIVFTAKPSEF